jgi:coproporphyrinogen III oxidase
MGSVLKICTIIRTNYTKAVGHPTKQCYILTMNFTYARSENSKKSLTLVEGLQSHFVAKLADATKSTKEDFEPTSWLRDDGIHGGGQRFGATDQKYFDRASVNVSQVNYDDLPDKPLGSATALSSIVHPAIPQAPSMHMHISWTEMKTGKGFWRIMADLNPSIPTEPMKVEFDNCLKEISGSTYDKGTTEGDNYFFIPALKRHRGVSHFYLEGYNTGDFEKDFEFAQEFGTKIIDCYTAIIKKVFESNSSTTDADKKSQLEYHTLYLFQVLTLDRGTTAGIMVHDQNDVGVMGSLPSKIDRDLLLSWKNLVAAPQDELVQSLADVLTTGTVDEEQKRALAATIRAHYTKHDIL